MGLPQSVIYHVKFSMFANEHANNGISAMQSSIHSNHFELILVAVMNRPENINRMNVTMGTHLMHTTKDSQLVGSDVSMSQ